MASDKITPAHILFPVTLLSFVMTIFLGFQTTLLLSDRTSLHEARAQQDKPLEQVEKIKTQVNALAIGTLKLSEQGNKDAAAIIAELKKAGVDVSDQPNPPAGMQQGGAMQMAPGSMSPGAMQGGAMAPGPMAMPPKQ